MNFNNPSVLSDSLKTVPSTGLMPSASSAPLTTSLPSSPFASRASSIAFIDGSTSEYQMLVAGVAPGTEVHILNSSQDAVTQITNTLLGRHNISSLHIVSHGEAGGLDFGTGKLNLSDLPEYAAQLQSWSKALTDDADILLYGCDVAQGEMGKAFTSILSQLTGADVAASTNLTGNSDRGGDWNLEYQTGSIETGLAFTQSARDAYTGTLMFAAPANVAVGQTPYGIATGDFNRDGKVDFAATNKGSGSVSIRLGAGDGTFTNAADVAVGTGPLGIAVGDFNGDSRADLAVSNASASTVSIRLGNGNGTFTNAADVTVGSGPSAVAIGDFNGDGKVDFVVVSYASNIASIRLNNGNGTFRNAADVTLAGSSYGVAIGDFNGDGKADFATANYGSGPVSIRLSNGDGTFTNAADVTVGPNSWSIATGDFNGDGKADFATADSGSNVASIRLGKGDGTFTNVADVTVGSAPFGITIADFNGDGKADFATSNQNDSTVSIRLGNGSGGFTTDSNVAVSGAAYTLTTGDFNADGLPDIATANIDFKTVSVLLNHPNAAPILTVSATALSYTENNPPLLIDTTATITDADSANFDTGTLTVNDNANGTVDDRLVINNQGTGAGQVGVSDSNVTYEGVTIGTFTGGTGTTPLVVTFNATATATAATALLQNLTYSNVSENPSSAPRTVQLVMTDGDGGTSTAVTKTINVAAINDAPVLTDTNGVLAVVNEDAGAPTGAVGTLVSTIVNSSNVTDADIPSGFIPGIAITTTDTSNGTWLYSTDGTTWNTLGAVSDANARLLTATDRLYFQPNANYNGTISDAISFRAWDQTSGNSGDLSDTTGSNNGGITAFSAATDTASLTVTAINDAPSFTKGSDQTITAGAGAQTLPNWATGFDPGSADESNQTAQAYLVTVDTNPAIFAVAPTIDSSGTLTYTPVTNLATATTATLSVRVRDSGGTANGGVDTSAVQTFAITVQPQPTLSIGNVSQTEGNSGTTAYTFTVSLSSTSTQTVAVNYTTADGTATVADGDYSAATGSLTFAPGETSKTITVNVKGDPNRELDETFLVNLLNPTNATLAANATSGTGTILNDDRVNLLWRSNNPATPSSATGQNAIWQMNGFTLESGYYLPTIADKNWQIISTADFNNDGTADILWRNKATGENAIWQMNSTGLQNAYFITSADLNWQIASTVDFNKDGIADILWRNKATGENAIWQMNSTGLQNGYFITTVADSNWQIASTADFNNDGTADILWRNKATGENAIWQMNGFTLQSSRFITPIADSNWQMVGTADFNNDGIADIVWRNQATGQNAIWQMNSTDVQTGYYITPVADLNWQIAGVADFNGDGSTDLLWRNTQAGKTGIWQMNGFTDSQTYLLPDVASDWVVSSLQSPKASVPA